MSFLRSLLAVAAALGIEALVGRISPGALGYLDLLLVVVAALALGLIRAVGGRVWVRP